MVNRIIRSNSHRSMGNLHTVSHNLSTVNRNILSNLSHHSMGNLHTVNRSPSTGNLHMVSLNIRSNRSSRNTRSSIHNRVISPSQCWVSSQWYCIARYVWPCHPWAHQAAPVAIPAWPVSYPLPLLYHNRGNKEVCWEDWVV